MHVGEGQHSEFTCIYFAYWSLGVDLQHRMFPQAWPLNTMGCDMLSHLFLSKRITGSLACLLGMRAGRYAKTKTVYSGARKSVE